ncbi:zinc finger protein 143-like [Phymastichus coffea]|uniref:zinc finger protein 143-like n=1 Tax=Phymastichus coffea TaxID=108790 RepID=UPI00273CDFA3|nr:zinc finger protein 143-like [Phymastichus coffea]
MLIHAFLTFIGDNDGFFYGDFGDPLLIPRYKIRLTKPADVYEDENPNIDSDQRDERESLLEGLKENTIENDERARARRKPRRKKKKTLLKRSYVSKPAQVKPLSFNCHKLELFKCPHKGCDKEFVRESAFLKHSKITCGKMERVCPRKKCDRIFFSRKAFVHHLKYICQSKTVHECTTPGCKKAYTQKAALTRHLEYECQVDPHFKCYYCDYVTYYPVSVRRHCANRHKRERARCIDTNTDEEVPC